jgi:hypothetical protein
MSTNSENTSNAWWCETCARSLPAGRAGAHLSSKKHAAAAAAGIVNKADDTGGSGSSGSGSGGSGSGVSGGSHVAGETGIAGEGKQHSQRTSRKATEPKNLIKINKDAVKKITARVGDPRSGVRKGNVLWCGICEVCLTPKQAEEHSKTKRHQDNSVKLLTSAMKGSNVGN